MLKQEVGFVSNNVDVGQHSLENRLILLKSVSPASLTLQTDVLSYSSVTIESIQIKPPL